MKLLVVTPFFAPAWGYGGPPKLLYEFAKTMIGRGHRIEVVTTDALAEKRARAGQDIVDGITVHRFKNVSNWLAWNQKIFLPLGLGDFLARNIDRYDFVFCSDLRHPLNILAFLACQKHRIPYGVAAFGEIPITQDWKGLLKIIYDLRFGRPMLRQATLLFAQTESEQAGYRTLIGDHPGIVLWPLAIDLAPFRHLPKFGTFRDRYHIATADQLLLFVGRFHLYKGIDRLIETVSQIRHALPHLRLVLVGRDDGALAKLKQHIRQLDLDDRVLLTGPLYNEEVIAAYRDADLFTMTPTHDEQTPLAGIMALAAGCPVVVTSNASIPWLDEYQAGVTLQNPADLTSTLQKILLNATVSKSMSQSARQLAFARYGWPVRAKEFEYLINSKV